MYKDYSTPYNGFIKLNLLFHEVGQLLSPGKYSFIAALTSMVSGYHLPKYGVITSAIVSFKSSEYASYPELRTNLMIELAQKLENQYDVAYLSGISLLSYMPSSMVTSQHARLLKRARRIVILPHE